MKNDDKNLTFMDRFWYKLFISIIILFALCLLDKFNVLNIYNLQSKINYNFNSLSLIEKVNGNVNIIDLGTEAETKVSEEVIDYISDNKVKTSELTGIKNYACGVCTKIHKDDTYTVTILGKDGREYIYGNIDKLDIHIYSYVKTSEVIGKSNEYYTFDIK